MTTVASRGGLTAGGRSIKATEKKPGGDVASRTDAATTNLAAFNTEDASQIDAAIQVTAAGTTMTVTLQTTMDGTNWYPVAAFSAMTGTGSQQMSFGGNLGVQCRWAVTAITGSFTWNLDHQARRSL
jgi:hypothetical protein